MRSPCQNLRDRANISPNSVLVMMRYVERSTYRTPLLHLLGAICLPSAVREGEAIALLPRRIVL